MPLDPDLPGVALTVQPPSPGQTTLSYFQSIKSNLAYTLAMEQAYQANHGPRLSYSFDGISYDWPGWEKAVMEKLDLINVLLQKEQPFIIRSRGRA
jgi:hypothetical protein